MNRDVRRYTAAGDLIRAGRALDECRRRETPPEGAPPGIEAAIEIGEVIEDQVGLDGVLDGRTCCLAERLDVLLDAPDLVANRAPEMRKVPALLNVPLHGAARCPAITS